MIDESATSKEDWFSAFLSCIYLDTTENAWIVSCLIDQLGAVSIGLEIIPVVHISTMFISSVDAVLRAQNWERRAAKDQAVRRRAKRLLELNYREPGN